MELRNRNPGPASSRLARDWMGTLTQRGTALRVFLHIRQGVDGALEGAMDNIDAGLVDIPIAQLGFGKSTIRFNVPMVDGSYRGTIRANGRSIAGKWRMGEDAMPLVLHRVKPSRIDGAWAGTLFLPEARLRLLFCIANSPDGMIATMKSPDQTEMVVATSSAELRGSTLVMGFIHLAARFEGRLNEAVNTIEGNWTQSGHALPLILRRTIPGEELKPSRPQEPGPPYPYCEKQVLYRSRGTSFALAGTLTIPQGKGPFPAVLLIAGSGALDRDETMYEHRPFLVLADWLTRRGFAVLRTDKRGVGESGGDGGRATTADLAMDAKAGMAYLKRRREVDQRNIGLVGHSEGGLIASMVAARSRDVAFVVLLAAPGLPGDEFACQQARRRAEIQGSNPEEVEQLTNEVMALLRKGKSEPALRRKLNQILSQLPDQQRKATVNRLMMPWLREFGRLDPAEYLRRVKCPALALNGDRDVSVEPKSNLARIRQSLQSGGNRNFKVVELQGLNHLFQTCKTGSETEYWHITETLSPVLLKKMVAWIAKCVQRA